MRHLNKHPRLLKKAAQVLKHLVIDKISKSRRKKLDKLEVKKENKCVLTKTLSVPVASYRLRLVPASRSSYEAVVLQGLNPKMECLAKATTSVDDIRRSMFKKGFRLFAYSNLAIVFLDSENKSSFLNRCR